MSAVAFPFDNTYARDLQGFYVPWKPKAAPAPKLLFLNHALADELGLDATALDGPQGSALFAGNELPDGAEPIAQAYAGHQFGGFSPQLGDGRAVLLGEVIDRNSRRRDIALKGSGRTPFARNGDGKAAVGPMLREVLVGEAMHALGIPTTRALAVAATGEPVQRESTLPGAVLTRVAASHIRVGTFQFFASRGETEQVGKLARYSIARHYPEIAGAPNPFLALLEAVAARQAALVAQWMNVGFIHGVMNTDNMAVSGETIDFGPCAFLEAYDPATVFSSIDHYGRYAYGNQPAMAQWNLARLAESLLPLIDGDAERAASLAMEVLNAFPAQYEEQLLRGQREKLGFVHEESDDGALAGIWLAVLQAARVDFTLGWRHLADATAGNEAPLRAQFADSRALDEWLPKWRERCAREDRGEGKDASVAALERAGRMRSVNPWVIPRNHRVEEALAAASNEGDLGPFEHLLDALRRPYEEARELARFAESAPAAVTACYQTFCGT